ncbi:MAG: hypothetical protein BVN32_14790 [Proteobacteria bacterium ST_bin14]|nr:MAG: hypothetical protein BVN32_14790 [Proteobacteria bacterium ST_bin14]
MMIHAARLAFAAPLVLAAGPVLAGQFQMMPAPTPEADALAADMRILGNNPFDLPALIRAGERTLKLGDMEAAAAFFQRAERISPNNGQIKAGKARTLVQLGRPGEALQLFNEAEALGYDLGSIAADRGLAFDLIGEQERAQRIYRQALKRQPDDETQRRYALSLGISGKRDMALDVIDGLLRRSDRAAWRVRAVVLAMNGDVAGAGRIADNMLPREMAAGLQPFFQILPGLGSADRAFAVHFGEVRATPERIADARMIPVLPVLIPEPVAVVQVAAAPVRTKAQQKRDRNRRRGAPVEVAALIAPPIPAPAQLPPPPRVVMAAPIPRSTPTPAPARTSTPPVMTSAAVITPPAARVPIANPPAVALRAPPAAPPAAPLAAPPVVAAASPMPAKTEATPPVTVAALSLPRPVSGPLIDQPGIAAPVQPSLTRPAPEAVRGDSIVNDPPVTATASNTPAPAVIAPQPAAPTPEPVPALAAAPAPAKAQLKPVASEESILARIIATIGVPASELERAPATAALAGGAAATIDPNKPPLLDKKALEKKALADKAAAQKKLADKKLADEKAAKLKAERADPSRIWVQVAGGSSVRDLPKEWARLRDKAPTPFKARSAYTTPLRFTNRLLAGPFKTDDDAQSFVNQIAKSGLTGFVFTSEAGQKITKLPAK